MTFRVQRAALILMTCAGLAVASGAKAAIVDAQITGGTALANGGVVVKLGPDDTPFTVGKDNFNNDNLYVFDEQQNVVLPQAISVNFGGVQISIAAGTVVSSHYIVFDPLAVDDTMQATVTFDGTILGIARKGAQLNNSNFLGLPGVDYLHPSGFALEPTDAVTIVSSTSTSLSLKSGKPGDVLRVITLALPVPEPTTWAFMVAGLGALGAAMRRPRRMVQFS